jgi:LPXTG-motif cell wall-anchored protein
MNIVWALVLGVPNILLAIGGWLLWRRHRSTATLLVVVGFTAILIALMTSLFESVEYSALYRAHADASLTARYHSLTQTAHWIGLLGLWAAAIGLLWHTARRHDTSVS